MSAGGNDPLSWSAILSADILVVIGLKEWGTSMSGYFGFWSAHFQGVCDRPPTKEFSFPLVSLQLWIS